MLKDLVLKNRSYRGYDHSYAIDHAVLEELADLARLCPSSVNLQPLKLFLACDPETVGKIQAQTAWAKGLPDRKLPCPGKEPTAFIVICQDDRIDENLNRFQRDVGILAQTMLLGAVEKGLGGCMIGNFKAQSLAQAVSLPEYLHPLLVVALGKPAEEIILVDVPENGNTGYYRDAQNRHFVPKRSLKELIIEKN